MSKVENKFDLAALRQILTVTEGREQGDVPWCRATFEDFETLHSTLFDAAKNTSIGMMKSKYEISVDFYNDLIFRHTGEFRAAFTSYNKVSQTWNESTYEEIHRISGVLAAHWKQAGLGQGETVVLVMSMTQEFLISLCAAFRLGAVVSVVAPFGDEYVRNRMTSLGSSFCVCDSQFSQKLEDWGYTVLPARTDNPPATVNRVQSHSYDWGDECLRLFSCWNDEDLEPITLTAGDVMTSIVIAELLGIRLGADDVVSFPGANPQQHMPTSLMLVLFAGATYAELSEVTACANPHILEAANISVISLTPKLRDALRESGCELKACRLWLRDISLSFEWRAWEDFMTALSPSKCFHANYLPHAAAGGVLLFSRWYRGNPGLEILPSPIHKLQLLDLNNSGEVARGNSGIVSFPQLDGSTNKFGTWIISQVGKNFMLGGSITPIKDGQIYIGAEICSLVGTHPLIQHACVVASPDSNALNDCRNNLIVLLDPRTKLETQSGQLKEEVLGTIMTDFGEQFLPDRIEFSTLFPRRNDDGEIDNLWIRDQFQTGFLARKEQIPVFNLVSQLSSIAENYK